MNWPMAKRLSGSGRGINKIPTNPKDVVVGDGSVLPPAHARSKSYRDVAMVTGSGQGRTLPQVILPGQASSSSSFDGPIRTDVPDIKLEVPRALILDNDGLWIPRINEASKRSSPPTCVMVRRIGDIMLILKMVTSGWLYSFSCLR